MTHFPTHIPISLADFLIAQDRDYAFFCGTNAFRKRWRLRSRKNQWALNGWQLALSKPIITLGVGWNSYKSGSGYLSSLAYRRLLCKKSLQSARDEFTARMLRNIGVKNVLNTGCATIWGLTPEHLSYIPEKKSDSAIFTITDYDRDPKSDVEMISALAKNYDKIIFWPQGALDLEYLTSLRLPYAVELLPSGLSAFDKALEANVDFVGTRLHAGIRALQKAKRSIIISIDNRAAEMQQNFNIPVVARGDSEMLVRMIRGNWVPKITLPLKNIEMWKSQFLEA